MQRRLPEIPIIYVRWGIAAAVACIIGGLLTEPARADCVSECQASTYCDSTMGSECGSRLNDCYLRECNRPTVSYGAIAYGKTSQAFGYSYGMNNTQAADKKALANCKTHGDDCAVVASMKNGCAAVAAAGGPGYAVAMGKTEEAAQSEALKSCKGNGIKGCEIQVWSCATP